MMLWPVLRQQALLQFVNVMHSLPIDWLLDDATFLVVDRIEIRAVW